MPTPYIFISQTIRRYVCVCVYTNKNAVQPLFSISHFNLLSLSLSPLFRLSVSKFVLSKWFGVCHGYTYACKARCKSLPRRPRHGMVIAPRMEHGSRALYKCKDGFQLAGSNVTECNYGNWSGLPPTCQESTYAHISFSISKVLSTLLHGNT